MSMQNTPIKILQPAPATMNGWMRLIPILTATVLSFAGCQSTEAATLLRPIELEPAVEGVWQDTKWGDLLTLRREKGILRVAAVIDNKTAEEFVVQESVWDANALTFRYRIRSNDTNVVSTIGGLAGDELAGTWRLEDNTNSGEFRYRKILAIAPPPEVANDEKKTVHQPVAKVYRVQGDTVTITSATMTKIKMHDKVYVIVGGRKIYLAVVFPMMTIARCKPVAATDSQVPRIAEGMTVYR